MANASPDMKLATVDQWYAAYDARDIDALCRLAHPEIEIVPASPVLSRLPGTTFHGHVGLRTVIRLSYDAYPLVRVKATKVRPIPGWILASTIFVTDDPPTDAATLELYTLFHVEGRRIRRIRAFATESGALRTVPREAKLTAREREVFQLLVRGMKAPQIADELFLSPATVRTHVQNAMARLGATTRIQAASIAIARGEIHP